MEPYFEFSREFSGFVRVVLGGGGGSSLGTGRKFSETYDNVLTRKEIPTLEHVSSRIESQFNS